MPSSPAASVAGTATFSAGTLISGITVCGGFFSVASPVPPAPGCGGCSEAWSGAPAQGLPQRRAQRLTGAATQPVSAVSTRWTNWSARTQAPATVSRMPMVSGPGAEPRRTASG